MYQNFIIPYLYEAQHVSGDTPSIIRSLKLHWQPLVFHMWKVVGRVVGGWKTGGCQCSFRLLMMGSVSPKTCWASYTYGIRFWYIVASCWNFFMKCTMMHRSTNIKSSEVASCVNTHISAHAYEPLQGICWTTFCSVYKILGVGYRNRFLKSLLCWAIQLIWTLKKKMLKM